MSGLWALTRATRSAVAARPMTAVTLLVFAGAIFVSQYLVLFEFHREENVLREMGIATMTLWGLLVAVVMSGTLVTHELEDRTALLLLSKPLSRSAFLVGKLLGMLWALLEGLVFLTLALFLTLWLYTGVREILQFDAFRDRTGPWSFFWGDLILPRLGFALQGLLLSFLQVAILGSISVALAAFFPVVVSVSATALFYMLGHVTRVLAVNAGDGPGGWLARGLAYVLPNFGYLNPTILLGEGGFLRPSYLLWVAAYSTIYVVLVLRVAALQFDRREIR